VARNGSTVRIGPKGQEVLKEFFTPDIGDCLFAPYLAMKELNEKRSAERRTPKWSSHMARNAAKRKEKAQWKCRESYDKSSLLNAVRRACDKAFPAPEPLCLLKGESERKRKLCLSREQQLELKKWQQEHRWHPNQIRHAYATRVRREAGLEAAQVLLGHAKADTTQIYAEKNRDLAMAVALKIG